MNHFEDLSFIQYHPLYSKKEIKDYNLELVFAEENAVELLHQDDALVNIDRNYHESTLFTIACYDQEQQIKYHPSRLNFKKVDYNLLNSKLIDINWLTKLEKNNFNLNICLNLFYLIIFNLIDSMIPRKSIKFKKFPHWFSIDLIKEINNIKKLHAKWKKTKNINNYILFKESRARCI